MYSFEIRYRDQCSGLTVFFMSALNTYYDCFPKYNIEVWVETLHEWEAKEWIIRIKKEIKYNLLIILWVLIGIHIIRANDSVS